MSAGVELTEAEARIRRRGLKILARMIARRYLEELANEERGRGSAEEDGSPRDAATEQEQSR